MSISKIDAKSNRLFLLAVSNHCKYNRIKTFTFQVTTYNKFGHKLNTHMCHAKNKNFSIAPSSTRNFDGIYWTIPSMPDAKKIDILVTSVTFADGTSRSIINSSPTTFYLN